MSEESYYESIPVGLDLGTVEITLDEDTVNTRLELVQWEARELLNKLHIAPPGMTITPAQRPSARTSESQEPRVAIWAKSEHEFLGPMKVGSKVSIRGKIVDKYVKRGRNYLVAEYEAFGEHGEPLLKSRETSVHVE